VGDRRERGRGRAANTGAAAESEGAPSLPRYRATAGRKNNKTNSRQDGTVTTGFGLAVLVRSTTECSRPASADSCRGRCFWDR